MITGLAVTAGAVLALIILAFFLSAAEAGLIASSLSRKRTPYRSADAAGAEKTAERDRVAGALLLGKTFVLVLAAALATFGFTTVFGPVGVVYAVLLMTVLLVLFGEIVPRTAVLLRPEKAAGRFGVVTKTLSAVLGPLATGATTLTRGLLKLAGVKSSPASPLLMPAEGDSETADGWDKAASQQGPEAHQVPLLRRLLELGELEVSDVMVHRTKMRSVNADDDPKAVVEELLRSPYTRTPVWRGSAENIIGIVHTKDLLRALHADPRAENIDITRIATKPWFVPDTTSVHMQLNAFLRRKAHMAIVVDEYGEVQGLVTLEDIIEEIVGDIADEHDVEVEGVRQEADGSIVVEGSVPIRDLNRALNWDLPDDEATTIAGLVIHESQTIPEEKQAFTFFDKRFIVMKREKNRITRLRIRPISVEESAKLR
ncbi:HlyC/CorC family transporter [Chelativorans composti]|jgi:Putative Mg2+ and Co2+ transporter CorB|uniref:HlyC/CorC family transporter n=1 Tax=Chelativorans composti TaxID=768533 RepID=A0ABW5DFK5_9HYPH